MADTTQYQGRFIELVSRDGWEFIRRTNATAVVAIAALTDQNEVILIEQTRKPLGETGERVIEIPAGLVGDDEADDTILDAARRELIEETGYTARKLEIVSRGPSSAGQSNEIITLVVAKGLTRIGDGGGIEGEDIITYRVPFGDVKEWLLDREAKGLWVDPKVWAALFWLS
jgi:ADP-ribose pyrophosphatase